MNEIMALLLKVPAEAYESLGRMLVAVLAGDTARAQREARVTSETVAAKLAIDAAYEAGVKARG